MKKFYYSLLLTVMIATVPQINFVKDMSRTNSLMSAISYPVAWAEGDFDRLHLSLKKLTSALASMKEFDKLEEQGLPKRQVQLMKNAMNSKIEKMMSNVLLNIQSL